jgi:hypothetical protein
MDPEHAGRFSEKEQDTLAATDAEPLHLQGTGLHNGCCGKPANLADFDARENPSGDERDPLH